MKALSIPRRSLILGGVKSGKSRHAETLAQNHSRVAGAGVSLIATARADDAEMERRIAHHKANRHPDWRVIEEPIALGSALQALDQVNLASGTDDCIVVDCLTLWLTNLLMNNDEALLRKETDCFLHTARHCQSVLVVVSNETNMGITPVGALSRRYCDEAGLLHQALGQAFDHVALLVAGIALRVK